MIALTTLLPRNSSRTSTHAVIVPTTALTAETSSAAPRLSLSAATASGCVATDQNCAQAVLPRRPDERGDRQDDDDRQEHGRETEREGRSRPPRSDDALLRRASGAA